MSPPQGGVDAIRHRDGPAMVLAGPGSGKTYTITRRFQFLTDELHIHPSSIITLTFTKAAAGEMRQRSLNLCGPPARDAVFATFHSAFYHILSRSAGLTSSDILDTNTKHIIFTDIIKSLGEDPADREARIDEMSAYISRRKNGLETAPDPCLENVLSIYMDRLKKYGLLDFDDMITKCRALFMKRSDVLAHWQARFRYIQIDEFQDINPLQYDTVKLLAGSSMNVFAVGDDDQSIYAFRGAKPGIMREFVEETNAVLYGLDTNYRCTQPIVDASMKVISENSDRMVKDIRALVQPGDPIDIRMFKDREAEVAGIAEALLHSDPSDCALLLRTNEMASYFAAALERIGVPVVIPGKNKSVYDSETAKDVMAYMRLACGQHTRSDILRVMNRPLRSISREAFGREGAVPADACLYYKEGEAEYESALAFCQDISVMGRMKPAGAMRYLMKVVGYEKYVCGNRTALQRLKELSGIADRYASIEAWIEDIEDGKVGAGSGQHQKGITVMTLHASKGLEFREVFIPDVNEGIIPYKRAALPEEIEEERRLFYVGMTRAIKKLHLFYIREHYGKPRLPSRFLTPLFPSDDTRGRG